MKNSNKTDMPINSLTLLSKEEINQPHIKKALDMIQEDRRKLLTKQINGLIEKRVLFNKIANAQKSQNLSAKEFEKFKTKQQEEKKKELQRIKEKRTLPDPKPLPSLVPFAHSAKRACDTYNSYTYGYNTNEVNDINLVDAYANFNHQTGRLDCGINDHSRNWNLPANLFWGAGFAAVGVIMQANSSGYLNASARIKKAYGILMSTGSNGYAQAYSTYGITVYDVAKGIGSDAVPQNILANYSIYNNGYSFEEYPIEKIEHVGRGPESDLSPTTIYDSTFVESNHLYYIEVDLWALGHGFYTDDKTFIPVYETIFAQFWIIVDQISWCLYI